MPRRRGSRDRPGAPENTPIPVSLLVRGVEVVATHADDEHPTCKTTRPRAASRPCHPKHARLARHRPGGATGYYCRLLGLGWPCRFSLLAAMTPAARFHWRSVSNRLNPARRRCPLRSRAPPIRKRRLQSRETETATTGLILKPTSTPRWPTCGPPCRSRRSAAFMAPIRGP